MIPGVTAFAALSGPLPKLGVVVAAALVAAMLLAGNDRARRPGRCSERWCLRRLSCWPTSGTRRSCGPCTATRCSGSSLRCWRWPWSLRSRLRSPGGRGCWRRSWCLRSRSGSRSRPAERRRTCWCRCTSSSRRARSAFIVPALREDEGFPAAQLPRPSRRDRDRDGQAATQPARTRRSLGPWIERLLALYVVLYAMQAVYSPDFEKALQQMVFFYVPFALMFALLRGIEWDRQLIRRCMELCRGARRAVRDRRVRGVRDQDDHP